MVTQICTKGFELSRGKRSLLEEHLLVGVRRYIDRISSVIVRLADTAVAGERWTCAMTIELDKGPQIDVTASAEGREESIDIAIHKARDRLRKTVGQRNPRRQSTRASTSTTR
ncbi:MAG TPA: HPF/RaiA family ribosome-associated protein [Phycisphaerae bacterium]|nr:HPF/RaiA family ribosome-associated protein [Phycisphaerae bacterium]HRW52323.1 HPF/RaiA family ribosome-associated protein [Phycisphaerae bacterium]